MFYFDTHIHFFPDNIAPKAIQSLSEICGIAPHTVGTLANTKQVFKDWNYCGGVALHIATNPHQQAAVNSFAIASQTENLLCFGSVHPDSPDIETELKRIKKAGLRGIKLHPDYQNFFVDEKRVFPIYETAAHLDLPITFHTGFDPLSPNCVHCTPEALAYVADSFPNLKIIGAHMGGSYMPDDAVKYLSNKKNVWIDTAIISAFLTPEKFASIVKAFGSERIFFATDCPWASALEIIKIIDNAGLTVSEREHIYYKNAACFFELTL
jgi:Predicted metal-dependent hydrolase of the TIM-barrel fold